MGEERKVNAACTVRWSFWLGRICLFRQLRMPQDSRIRVISRAGSGNISVSRRAAIDG